MYSFGERKTKCRGSPTPQQRCALFITCPRCTESRFPQERPRSKFGQSWVAGSHEFFRGPVEQDGSLSRKTTSLTRWQAMLRSGSTWMLRCGPGACRRSKTRRKVLEVPASVSFQDQTGAPASLDEQGNTSRVTAEYFEFFRGPLRGEKTRLETAPSASRLRWLNSPSPKWRASRRSLSWFHRRSLSHFRPWCQPSPARPRTHPWWRWSKKQLAHENQRADKATDAVLRMLKTNKRAAIPSTTWRSSPASERPRSTSLHGKGSRELMDAFEEIGAGKPKNSSFQGAALTSAVNAGGGF